MPRGLGRGMRQGWWHGKLRGCGYRLTLPRQAILEVLENTSKHLSAEDVFMAVKKKYPQVGLTTVYRTLELLVEMGLVFRFDFGDGRARFEMSEGPQSKDHHHHLICSACGRVIDYTDFIKEEVELLNKTEKGLSKKYDFNIKNHLIQFFGLCKQCK